MIKFLIRSVVAAAALWVAAYFLDGITTPDAQSDQQFVLYLLGAGAIFTLVTMIIRPVVVVLSIPLYILTLGLFAIVVNALMLLLSSWIANQFGWGLHVESFWWAVAGGLIISVFMMIVDALLPRNLRR